MTGHSVNSLAACNLRAAFLISAFWAFMMVLFFRFFLLIIHHSLANYRGQKRRGLAMPRSRHGEAPIWNAQPAAPDGARIRLGSSSKIRRFRSAQLHAKMSAITSGQRTTFVKPAELLPISSTTSAADFCIGLPTTPVSNKNFKHFDYTTCRNGPYNMWGV